jgi:hypothetical protein
VLWIRRPLGLGLAFWLVALNTLSPAQTPAAPPPPETPALAAESKLAESAEAKSIEPAEAKPTEPAEAKPIEPAEAKPAEPAQEKPVELAWQTDYATAMEVAKEQKKLMLIFFFDPANERSTQFEQDVLGSADVRKRLCAEYICLRLAVDAKIQSGEEEITLIKHTAYKEMLGQPGIAVVDFAHPDTPLDSTVVSTFPLTPRLSYTPEQMLVILGLPPGTLTQRTLIYAVRIHPERPASTNGEVSPRLMAEAESHSCHQSRIRLQGHHQWETRFHIINAILPRGLMALEVCAESWPGQNLVDSAIECVRCWRYSSGHWSAVRANHPLYGYDMKLGSNGVWYATGIFGCR